MSRTHKNKQYKTFALYLLLVSSLLSFGPSSFAYDDNEVMPANKTELSLLLGSYSLNATNPPSKISSIGAFTVGFTYRFFERISANAAYNNLMTFSGSLSSIVSGFDLGASYCFFTCSAMKQKLSDAGLVVAWSPWGIQLGAGFAARSIQLANASVGFSGPYLKAVGNYMLGDRFKVLGAVQYTTMSNASKGITQMTFQAGVGFDFGENVYDSVHK